MFDPFAFQLLEDAVDFRSDGRRVLSGISAVGVTTPMVPGSRPCSKMRPDPRTRPHWRLPFVPVTAATHAGCAPGPGSGEVSQDGGAVPSAISTPVSSQRPLLRDAPAAVARLTASAMNRCRLPRAWKRSKQIAGFTSRLSLASPENQIRTAWVLRPPYPFPPCPRL
jgi:hypothetical protein